MKKYFRYRKKRRKRKKTQEIMEFKEKLLAKGEFFETTTKKDSICIHHTEGGHRPDWIVNYWNADRSGGGSRIRVGTTYIIGGISTSTGDDKWDGVIVRCMDEKHWAHHLGIKAYNNTHLNKKTIGIEICNYGHLIKGRDDKYYNWVNKQVPEEQVVDLGFKFRGYQYYHKYTKKQIEATKQLLLYLKKEHNIDLTAGLKERITRSAEQLPEGLSILDQQEWLNSKGYIGDNGKVLTEDGIDGRNTRYAVEESKKHAFDISEEALDGDAGLWTHTSYRKDKRDCFPQTDLIKLIKSL